MSQEQPDRQQYSLWIKDQSRMGISCQPVSGSRQRQLAHYSTVALWRFQHQQKFHLQVVGGFQKGVLSGATRNYCQQFYSLWCRHCCSRGSTDPGDAHALPSFSAAARSLFPSDTLPHYDTVALWRESNEPTRSSSPQKWQFLLLTLVMLLARCY